LNDINPDLKAQW